MTRTTRTTLLVAAFAGTLLYALPAQAQRVFVSATGSDSNPCSFASPCRSFQHAHDTVPAGGEINVLDPSGYGPLTITKAINIQARGFGGITQASSSAYAITINTAGTNDAVTLNGLIIDGSGTGNTGILINKAGSVQILNCVVRGFAREGILFQPGYSTSYLLVSDTVASENGAGIHVKSDNSTLKATLNRITANHNHGAGGGYGVVVAGPTMITNSVISNNSFAGLFPTSGGTAWLGTSTISGNTYGVFINGIVNSYGNNAIDGNFQDVVGTLTKISPQ